MNVYAWIWLAWIIALIVIETIAALDQRPGPTTLSEYVWKLFNVRGTGARSAWRRWLLLIGMALLAAHFIGGGRFP